MIASFGDHATRDVFDSVNSKAARAIPRALWPIAKRKLDGLGNHGARRNFGVVKIHPLGKRVADAEQVDELRKRIVPQHAVLFEVHGESVVVNDEALKNARIVVLRKSAKISVTTQVVEQIGADGAADDIRSIGLVAFQDPDHRLLQPFTFEDPRYSRHSQEVIDSLFIFVVPGQNAAFIFESVSEWDVRNIVKKCRHSNQPFLILRNRFGPADSLENAIRHPRRTQRMLKACVNGGRKDQISRS